MTTPSGDKQTGTLAARLTQIARLAETEISQLTDEQLTAGLVELARALASVDELITRLNGVAEDRALARGKYGQNTPGTHGDNVFEPCRSPVLDSNKHSNSMWRVL